MPRNDAGPANGGPSPATPLQLDGVSVPGAARALAVFEIFGRERRGLTKSELARLMGLSQSSISDLLNTLRDLGYVSRTVTTRQFYPTSRLGRVASAIPTDGLSTFGAEAAGLLASQTGETACFAVLGEGSAEILAAADGTHRLRYVISAGDTVTLHATSIGKAILSGLSREARREILGAGPLQRLTPRTKVDPDQLEAELTKSARLGYFRAVDEGTVGVSSIAVAGMVDERPVGLGVIGPTERLAEKNSDLIAQLLDVRKAIFEL